MANGNDLVDVVFDVAGYPGESAAANFAVKVKDKEMSLGGVSVAFGSGTPFDSAGGMTITNAGKSITGNAGVDLKAFTDREAKAILSGTVGGQQFFFEKLIETGPPLAADDSAGDDSEE